MARRDHWHQRACLQRPSEPTASRHSQRSSTRRRLERGRVRVGAMIFQSHIPKSTGRHTATLGPRDSEMLALHFKLRAQSSPKRRDSNTSQGPCDCQSKSTRTKTSVHEPLQDAEARNGQYGQHGRRRSGYEMARKVYFGHKAHRSITVATWIYGAK